MIEENIKKPPEYCEYSKGQCDRSFESINKSAATFLYPSDPSTIALTIKETISKLKQLDSSRVWTSWEDLGISGQIIFCTICKSMRFSEFLITDVTTLNFNVMFEIGYALGLDLPVVPIRDTSFIRDKSEFDRLGLLDTIGFIDFQNSNELSQKIISDAPFKSIPAPPIQLDFQAPLYVIKGPHETEGEVRLLSVLKKSSLKFRSYDILETPRLSLHEVRRKINNSFGIVGHLLNSQREGARVHNARCALAAGLAMAKGKYVLLLQEEGEIQPIDYRDIIQSYRKYEQIPDLLQSLILQGFNWLQEKRITNFKAPKGLLQKLDIGDVAAENEIRPLRSYFVETGQYYNAKRGHARLVVGRKGAGKTAIFYAIRDSLGRGPSLLTLDLKPEGHQFTKLRDFILSKMNPGMQEHTLTAFWTLILLTEIAHKVITTESKRVQYDIDLQKKFNIVYEIYQRSGFAEQGDFSERLFSQVNQFIEKAKKSGTNITSSEMTEFLFKNEIKILADALADYLEYKDDVYLLIDNIDKGWPTRGAKTEDILIIRTLLEATRKIQRQLEDREVNFHCLVFLRNDIYENLIIETPDKGKDTAINLDMTDPEFYKNLYRLRVISTELVSGNFDEVWGSVFDPFIKTKDSFSYILDLTLKRPRDFLNMIHRSIEVAINRGNERVSQEDMLQAEKMYSDDMIKSISFELQDVYPQANDVLYRFIGCNTKLSENRG